MYDCGDSTSVNFLDRVIYLILSDFSDEATARDYYYHFGLSIIKERGLTKYKQMIGFKICGITIKKIMREVGADCEP